MTTPNEVWWDAVVLTASNARQAERYRREMDQRRLDGRLPEGVRYLVVADPGDQRVGSGTATILALAALAAGEEADYWARSRVLLIHSGGDSRRLPQYSPQGKLFGVLPGAEAETTSVFDETMALSTAWVERMGPGVLVMSGDVLLEFDAAETEWGRPGVTAAAMRLPVEVGQQHGVYVVDPCGRVYTMMQKPSVEEMRAAGALFEDGRTAVDIGLRLRRALACCAPFRSSQCRDGRLRREHDLCDSEHRLHKTLDTADDSETKPPPHTMYASPHTVRTTGL